ncbi:hypothetical protein [Treponema sp. R6D11]
MEEFTKNKSEEIYHEPHERGANLDGKEIYYKYVCSRKIKGSGVVLQRLGFGLYDKITDKNP